MKSLGMLLRCSVGALLLGAVGAVQAVPITTGDIFASIGNGQIQQRSGAGALLDTLTTGQGGFTTGSAFDSSGNFYVTNFSTNSVTKFAGPGDPHTTSLFGSGYVTPEAIVFAADGHVLVGNVGGGIREMDAAGNFVKTILPGTRVDWFDLAADQDTILYTQEGGQVLSASRSTGLATGPFSSVGGDFALRFLPGGGVLVANNESILRLSSTGALLNTYDVSGVDGFFALNLDPDGTSFLTGSFADGNIYRFNIGTAGVNQLDTQTQTIATGCGGSCLFGLSVFGEITVAEPPPTNGAPEPGTIPLLGLALAGLAACRARKQA